VSDIKFVIIIIAVITAAVFFIVVLAHKDDASMREACEAKGGTFVWTRSGPFCLKEVT